MKNFLTQLLNNTRDRRKRGFTLIELLIVIGILGILVVAVLLTLNPAEAQRKARDNVRIKDMSTLLAVIQQYLDAGGAAQASGGTGWLSTAGGQPQLLNCSGVAATSWLPLNVCPYISALPDDPMVGQTRACAGGAGGAGTGYCNVTGTPPTPQPQPMRYRVCMDVGGNFAVNVRQESQSNLARVQNDFPGQQPDSWAEVRSLPTLAAPPAPCGVN